LAHGHPTPGEILAIHVSGPEREETGFPQSLDSASERRRPAERPQLFRLHERSSQSGSDHRPQDPGGDGHPGFSFFPETGRYFERIRRSQRRSSSSIKSLG